MLLHINVTWRRRSKTAMSMSSSMAWMPVSKRLRSEGRGDSEGGQGYWSRRLETRDESWRFSSAGSVARGACQTAPCLCWPSPATSTHLNQCCGSHREAAGGWFPAAAVHGPRYCSGCLGSGPALGRRPARPDPSSTHPLAEKLRGCCLIHESYVASRLLRSPRPRRRFALRKRWTWRQRQCLHASLNIELRLGGSARDYTPPGGSSCSCVNPVNQYTRIM